MTWVPEIAAALWSIAYLVASRTMPRVFGKAVVGGMELWRGVWAMPTQFVVFPVAFACRGPVADWLFTFVFAKSPLLYSFA